MSAVPVTDPVAEFDADSLAWSCAGGLVAAIVQHAATGTVLMLGWMNRAALQQTLATRQVTFWSRSRQRLWTKGESSGNTLALVAIARDCDGDSLLLQALPAGPTCHLGSDSCFGEVPADCFGDVPADWIGDAPADPLQALDAVIAQRLREPPLEQDGASYTAQLFAAGVQRIAQKVGEEGVEVALAAVAGDRDAVLGESADLVYHLLVLLHARGCSLADLRGELARRQRKQVARR